MTSTTRTDEELVDQLKYEFAKQCNYILTKRLEKLLERPAMLAAQVCKDLKVDPATYVTAHVTFAPVLKGQSSLLPTQLITKESKIYITNLISSRGKRHVDREFETECRMLALCLESGWSERLALLNSTFDFSPWFRILMSSVMDEELITQYGNMAAQILNNDKELVTYLKTVKSDAGAGLDFNRIPGFKL